jgi:hypothetical protein
MTMPASVTEMLAVVSLSSAASDLSALSLTGGLMVIRRDGGNEIIAAQGLQEPALP